jgi:F0F1-type ATP synthase assembly protein I
MCTTGSPVKFSFERIEDDRSRETRRAGGEAMTILLEILAGSLIGAAIGTALLWLVIIPILERLFP